jgi:putative transposase
MPYRVRGAQVADRAEPFVSRVRARLAGRTAELERLAIEMFARGLSTRDIEAAFRDDTGASMLSRTAVSQVTSGSVRSTRPSRRGT